LYRIFSEASETRIRFFENKVAPCSIINARSGNCPENCAFCAQSRSSRAEIEKYPLLDGDTIFEQARKAELNGSSYFSIVTSGRAINQSAELDSICSIIERISEELNIKPCASLGILDKKALKQLKDAGLARYHHNLETSPGYFARICTTRTFANQTATVKNAIELGIPTCCGGIFGLGEPLKERIELLEAVRKLNVDSVPLNFLSPIPGTRLEHMNDLSPLNCLKIISAARLMMPDKSIRICGGREYNLRDFQSWIFFAGANGIMTGNYLVTSGRDVQQDLQMIKDAGLELKS
jgi:biotin synthase